MSKPAKPTKPLHLKRLDSSDLAIGMVIIGIHNTALLHRQYINNPSAIGNPWQTSWDGVGISSPGTLASIQRMGLKSTQEAPHTKGLKSSDLSMQVGMGAIGIHIGAPLHTGYVSM